MIIYKGKGIIFLMIVFIVFALSGTAQADITVYKAYKQAFPDVHPKCSSCHVDAMPKKAEGQHEWNAYGKALKKAINDAGVADVPTGDDAAKITAAIDKVGKIEDFKPSGN